jgi:uncharacterized protein (DUF39 family)
MPKTIREINERIRSGQVVVVDAEEIIDIVAQKGAKKAAEEVDIVTTGTFGPMCSSGAFLNTGHTKPRCKFSKVWLNNVSAYTGVAAVDLYIGATELPEGDPANSVFPGRFLYGGGHVIEDLVAGKEVEMRVQAYGTDCYPRKEVRSWIALKNLNQAVLTNPRNAYQNYNVAVNRDAKRVIYTYMGVLQPNIGNANYCSAGQLSPLMNDPNYRTIGIGTRIFLGGGVGYVWWEGTQHAPSAQRTDKGIPMGGAGTLAVCGDLKQMNARWLRGASLTGYGVSLAVGIGVPIPVLDEQVAAQCAVSDADIVAPIVDYSTDYPQGVPGNLGYVSYKELKSGAIMVQGRKVPTAGLSSYKCAKEIAATLKEWIRRKEFLLSEPVQPLPGAESGQKCKLMTEKAVS